MKKLLLSTALACSMALPATSAPVQWTVADGGNDHWYEVIWLQIGQITWDTAKASAESMTHMGQSGYLASITSGAEQAFLNVVNNDYTTSSNSHSGTYVRAWIGGNDLAVEGTFEWTTGEAFSYTNWDGGEPNNFGGNEDHVVGWWDNDRWNDCSGTCGTHKYIVEYDSVAQVPLPASLPLLGFALAGLAGFARKRKKAA